MKLVANYHMRPYIQLKETPLLPPTTLLSSTQYKYCFLLIITWIRPPLLPFSTIPAPTRRSTAQDCLTVNTGPRFPSWIPGSRARTGGGVSFNGLACIYCTRGRPGSRCSRGITWRRHLLTRKDVFALDAILVRRIRYLISLSDLQIGSSGPSEKGGLLGKGRYGESWEKIEKVCSCWRILSFGLVRMEGSGSSGYLLRE